MRELSSRSFFVIRSVLIIGAAACTVNALAGYGFHKDRTTLIPGICVFLTLALIAQLALTAAECRAFGFGQRPARKRAYYFAFAAWWFTPLNLIAYSYGYHPLETIPGALWLYAAPILTALAFWSALKKPAPTFWEGQFDPPFFAGLWLAATVCFAVWIGGF